MDKHVFLCETESEYESLTYEAPHVALTEDDDTVHYDEAVENKEYKFLDILWNDGKVTADLREEDAEQDPDLAPIAICVIPTGYLGEGEKARFMALLYPNGYSTVKSWDSHWAPDSPSENDPLEDMYMNSFCKNVNNGDDVQGDHYSYEWNSTSNTGPDLRYNEEGTAWNNAKQYLDGKYILGDVNGLENHKKIIENLDLDADHLSTYAFTVINKFVSNIHPKYNLKFNWYLPAAGEFLNMLFNLGWDKYASGKFPNGSINYRLEEINAKYPDNSMSGVSSVWDGCYFWISNPVNASEAFQVSISSTNITLGPGRRRSGFHVIAFLQL